MIYAVARTLSNVTAAQFRNFCERVDAPLKPAPPAVKRLFDPDLIEDVFAVEEPAFDAVKLKQHLWADLEAAGIEMRLGAEALRLESPSPGAVAVTYRASEGEAEVTAAKVYNCCYSRLNRLLHASGLAPIALKHELTEIALIEIPAELRDLGVTVVCGPFFSTMPYPPRGLHSLSHVRYTPHREWHDEAGTDYQDPYQALAQADRRSRHVAMIRDASRYLPALASSRYVDSLWEVKTVLPRSDSDDSRPILLHESQGAVQVCSILGAKIDNIYDMTSDPALVPVGHGRS
jgi:glycine/D-amino acid oxidase-like deaminating enzyme